jgi:hypothetical protein
MRRGAAYPEGIAARYYKALDEYTESKYDPLIKNFIPNAQELQIMDVITAAANDCDNRDGKYKQQSHETVRSHEMRLNWYCKRYNDRYYAKALTAVNARQTKVEVFDCMWERISQDDQVALDMVFLYNYRPNAAYLCAMTLTTRQKIITETAGYFGKMSKNGAGSWIYMGGFDDIKIPLRRVRLHKDILDNPEAAARRRWDALPK